MKVKMLKTVAGRQGVLRAGHAYNLNDRYASELVRLGIAENTDEPAREAPRRDRTRERAAVAAAPENTATTEAPTTRTRAKRPSKAAGEGAVLSASLAARPSRKATAKKSAAGATRTRKSAKS